MHPIRDERFFVENALIRLWRYLGAFITNMAFQINVFFIGDAAPVKYVDRTLRLMSVFLQILYYCIYLPKKRIQT